MDDMERYGDYNEIDEAPGGKHPVLLVLKILIFTLIFLIIGFLIFRIALFNYYPKSMSRLYFNDTLTDFYNEKDGEIGAVTQALRFNYDDSEDGNFFADHLIVIREAGQLQISVRYNKALIDSIEEEYGITVDDPSTLFSFTLARDPRNDPETDGKEGEQNGGEKAEVISEPVGVLTVNETDSLLFYTYHKLVFDGIDFGSESEPEVEWLRVEINLNGVETDGPFMILIYENNPSYDDFVDYKPSKSEVPS